MAPHFATFIGTCFNRTLILVLRVPRAGQLITEILPAQVYQAVGVTKAPEPAACIVTMLSVGLPAAFS